MTAKKIVKKTTKNTAHSTTQHATAHKTHVAPVDSSCCSGEKKGKGHLIFLVIVFALGFIAGQFIDIGGISLGSKGLTIYVLSDETCPTCDTSAFITTTVGLFPEAKIVELDISESKGKKLVDKYELAMLPSYVFEGGLEEEEAWTTNPALATAFEEVDGAYKLLDVVSGASKYLDPEKQKEQDDMLANYVNSNIKALGTDLEKPRYDYFVMSFCPYGNPADEAAYEVYKLLGDSVDIVPHYIMSVVNNDIQSLHGVQEGNQGVRELCALKELGMKEFFEFTIETNTACNAQNVDSCWEDAAEAVGLSVSEIAKIQSCHDDNRLDIASEEDAMIQSLRILRQGDLVTPSASPTLMVNGETFGSRDAESIKNALCSKFDGNAPSACDDVITADVTAPVGNC